MSYHCINLFLFCITNLLFSWKVSGDANPFFLSQRILTHYLIKQILLPFSSFSTSWFTTWSPWSLTNLSSVFTVGVRILASSCSPLSCNSRSYYIYFLKKCKFTCQKGKKLFKYQSHLILNMTPSKLEIKANFNLIKE